jgi:hypothetical protein
LPPDLPPIFKITIGTGHVRGEIFVTKSFADILVESKLSGAELADPKEYDLEFVLAGRSQNVVPGIIG